MLEKPEGHPDNCICSRCARYNILQNAPDYDEEEGRTTMDHASMNKANAQAAEKRERRRVTFGLFSYQTKKVEYTEFGYFHSWGLDVEEYESGGVSFSAAIIEMKDGAVKLVQATNVKFLD